MDHPTDYTVFITGDCPTLVIEAESTRQAASIIDSVLSVVPQPLRQVASDSPDVVYAVFGEDGGKVAHYAVTD